jgi:hypothetical protein
MYMRMRVVRMVFYRSAQLKDQRIRQLSTATELPCNRFTSVLDLKYCCARLKQQYRHMCRSFYVRFHVIPYGTRTNGDRTTTTSVYEPNTTHMLDQDEIDRQQQLLATHRRTLAHYLHQLAKLGELHTPPGVIHGIEEARDSIRQIKQTLRAQGVTVDDYADDESRNPQPRPTGAELQSPLRPLRVFLCHSSGDKPEAYRLYQRLRADGFEPWLDKEDLLPGQDWRKEIPKAVRAADVVLVCLSRGSIAKNGYVQQEIEFALDAAENQPAGAIYLIPLKLKPCTVPDRLSRWQWVDLFEGGGYERLTRALRSRASALRLATPEPLPLSEPALRLPQSTVSRLSLFPLTAHSRRIVLAAIGLIGVVLVTLVAVSQFNMRASGTIVNNPTSGAIRQQSAAPTASIAIAIPATNIPATARPTAQPTTAATSTATEQATVVQVIAPTDVAHTPTDLPQTNTALPTPKLNTATPKPTARPTAKVPTSTPVPPTPTEQPKAVPYRLDVAEISRDEMIRLVGDGIYCEGAFLAVECNIYVDAPRDLIVFKIQSNSGASSEFHTSNSVVRIYPPAPYRLYAKSPATREVLPTVGNHEPLIEDGKFYRLTIRLE